MLITLPRILEKDVIEFCNMNNITDINDFIVKCFRNGYNIVKFGLSPKDNFQKQNKPLEVEVIYDKEESDTKGREEKPPIKGESETVKRSQEKSSEREEKEVPSVKGRRTSRNIKIIKK